MIKTDDNALKIAEFLLQIKATEINPSEPFTWASGLKSPIYCDNRKTLSYPQIRTFIRQEFVKVIERDFGKPDLIAGVATGGIALGALIAQELGIPFVYVRSDVKKHGLTNQVEGVTTAGQSVVVVEDLVSTGMSSLKAVDALKELDLNIMGMVAIFNYGFDIADDNFKNAGVDLVTLADYSSLIETATTMGFVPEEDSKTLIKWRQDPKKWSDSFSK